MAGNRRKDLVLQWKNLFHLLPPLKLQWQHKKRDGGSSMGSSSVFFSQGTIKPQWVAHSQRVLLLSSGVRENKRPVSILLLQYFFLPHTPNFMANLFLCGPSSCSKAGSSAAQPAAPQLPVHCRQHGGVQEQHRLSSASDTSGRKKASLLWLRVVDPSYITPLVLTNKVRLPDKTRM